MFDALEKLCKWRSILTGWHLGTRREDAPGVRAMRDLMDFRLIMRAEGNALAALLIEKGMFTEQEFADQVRAEATYLDAQMEKQFPGFRTSPTGIVIYDTKLADETCKRLGFPA